MWYPPRPGKNLYLEKKVTFKKIIGFFGLKTLTIFKKSHFQQKIEISRTKYILPEVIIKTLCNEFLILYP